ncbi:hypothetical protein CK203_067785 [Vitis vinifera]|uniref:Neprosin PEP catalytic domain-containing protein n=1 Tax=Vitis vinifera TaxID=29760 RepID=A0A438BZ73_VITVI|nr:hypothetical protein CK203_067785 [Vitis vinifera]
MKLSKEEDLEIEKELKRLNKPAMKTIKTKYGDIYDCVDFYKQPAFDHPLLKNHNFHPQMRPTSPPRRVSPEKEVPKPEYKRVKIGLEGGGCPMGTVPIRRTTKDDLIRAKLYSEMHASKINPLTDDQPGKHFAVAQTIADIDYDGVGAILSVWNLPVQAPQYTSGRVKIKNGAESLEAGWTVNPGLYGGDNRTRMYIYTNAGQAHCFNTPCGFIQASIDIPVDMVLEPVSRYGEKPYGITLSIYQDTINLSWYLYYDNNRTVVGWWPSQIFTNLGSTATGAEWGGEVFSPPNVPSPGMGSGHEIKLNTNYDAFCAQANIVVNNTIIKPPRDLEQFSDNFNFHITNKGDVGGDPGYLILYGGVSGAIGN